MPQYTDQPDDIAASSGVEVRRTTEPRRGSLVDGDATDADATARADAAVLALQSASASVDDALAEVERQVADAQLRLDPERDQATRAAEAVKRETEAEELKQTTDEFVKAGARLAESLRQVTAVSFTASEAAAIVVKAVCEIVELATQLATCGRGIKFTPERIQQIRNLVERGKSREEIAELIGVTVGSLQVTCSKLGISLRRVPFHNGMRLLWRDGPHNGTSTYSASRLGGVPLPSMSGQPPQNSLSKPVKQPEATTSHEERARADEMGLATFGLTMKYRGHERTTELPLTQHMIMQLVFEAQFRNMRIGALVGELLLVIMKRDIFQHVLEPNSKQP
jgi:DNA-binding NarL/FixJ family response regulator